jgi:hypothetical protein
MLKQVHAKGNWRSRHAATHPAREHARLATLAVLGRLEAPRWKRAKFRHYFYWHDARGRDPANALAACKAIHDGIADAGIVENDRGAFPSIEVWEIDRDNPRLVICCEEMEAPTSTPHPSPLRRPRRAE